MGRLRLYHRPEPSFFDPTVCVCGLHISRHVPRSRRCREPKERKSQLAWSAPIFAIDGEGMGRRPHRYVYIACVAEDGRKFAVEDRERGLSTRDCLDFLTSLAKETKYLFGFGLGYDYSMMLRDLPPEKLYLLTHPELRSKKDTKGFKRIRPITWGNYRLNYVQRKLTIQKIRWPERLPDGSQPKPEKVGRSISIWDVFPFFQTRFTTTLKDWKIIGDSDIEVMQGIKDSRAHLESLPWDTVKLYCLSECASLSKLVRKLIDAHRAANLQLKGFYGAGSTASALLTRMNVKEYLSNEPDRMTGPAAIAFSGGRFENALAGPVELSCFGKDIASAYPYHTSFLPCLRCGKWERVVGRNIVNRDFSRSALACIRVKLHHKKCAWGPFPFRDSDGTITYPLSFGESWVWKDEFYAAIESGFDVEALEAWVYHTPCDHRPFAELPLIYKERVRIGKDGPGIVLKLGPNSVYGKLAQTTGNAPFRNQILAGNITSATRAQLLRLMAKAGWEHVLMVATDGIVLTRDVIPPEPWDTGTAGLTGPDGPKPPLGAWENKPYPKGVFLIRPGIYFPLRPSEKELKEVKSRGIAKKSLLESHGLIVETFEKYGPTRELVVPGERFVGMKGGITRRKDLTFKRSNLYCDWHPWPITISYDPQPKREKFGKDMRTLIPWKRKEGASAPYEKGVMSIEALQLERLEMIMSEDPDES